MADDKSDDLVDLADLLEVLPKTPGTLNVAVGPSPRPDKCARLTLSTSASFLDFSGPEAAVIASMLTRLVEMEAQRTATAHVTPLSE